MDSSTPLSTTRPTPRRVSQDPLLFCRHAPSPLTPGSPMRASARCFRIGGRLQHLRKIGRCHWCNEAESGSQSLGSRLRSRHLRRLARPHARPDRSVSRRQLPSDAGPELHAERAIHMADTSQSARTIWVTLAQPKKRSERRRNEATSGHHEPALSCSRRASRPPLGPGYRGSLLPCASGLMIRRMPAFRTRTLKLISRPTGDWVNRR
jgi:hypothetical protein